MSKMLLVRFDSIMKIDNEIISTLSLPLGQNAMRPIKGAAWQYEKV